MLGGSSLSLFDERLGLVEIDMEDATTPEVAKLLFNRRLPNDDDIDFEKLRDHLVAHKLRQNLTPFENKVR